MADRNLLSLVKSIFLHCSETVSFESQWPTNTIEMGTTGTYSHRIGGNRKTNTVEERGSKSTLNFEWPLIAKFWSTFKIVWISVFNFIKFATDNS